MGRALATWGWASLLAAGAARTNLPVKWQEGIFWVGGTKLKDGSLEDELGLRGTWPTSETAKSYYSEPNMDIFTAPGRPIWAAGSLHRISTKSGVN